MERKGITLNRPGVSLRKVCLMLFLFFLFFWPGQEAFAVEIFNEDFKGLEQVDTFNTTADIDTSEGWAALPRRPLPNALDVRAAGWENAVASQNGIEVYTYDDAAGIMVRNEGLSMPEAKSSTGVACRDDAAAIWSLTPTSLTLYSYIDGKMQNSPARTVAGLEGLLSASAWEGVNQVVVLLKTPENEGRIEVYKEVSGQVNLCLVMDTHLADPVAVATVPGTPDFLYATGTGAYYYLYDDATGGFFLHPLKQFADLSGVRSISVKDRNAFLAAEGHEVNYYLWTEPAGAAKADRYSNTDMADLLSVSMKPGEDEYATLTAGGNQDYWMFSDLTGGMMKNDVLSRSGLDLNLQYLTPAEYRSVIIPTAVNYDTVRLSAVTDIPEGTAVKFYVSADGGINWTETANNEWLMVPAGNRFCVKAVLMTDNPAVTPKIMSVTLEASLLEVSNLKVLAVAANYTDQAFSLTEFPVRVRAGAMLQFEVDTSGFAESARAIFSVGEDSEMVPCYDPCAHETNSWRGSYLVPEEAVEGSCIRVNVIVKKDGREKTLT